MSVSILTNNKQALFREQEKKTPLFPGGRMDEATLLGGRWGEKKRGWGIWWQAVTCPPCTEEQLRLRSFLCTSLDAAWHASWDSWERKEKDFGLHCVPQKDGWYNGMHRIIDYLNRYLGTLVYSCGLQKVKFDKGHTVLVHTVLGVDTVCSVMQNLFRCPEQVRVIADGLFQVE